MSTKTAYDPREEITHPIRAGQVYQDESRGTDLACLLVTDEIVVCRDLGTASNKEWLRHRLERRREFDQRVGSGRYELIEEDGEHTSAGKIRKLERLQEQYADADGRKAEHKASALEEAVDVLSGEVRSDDNEAVVFEDVSGIGQKTADRLRSAGFSVKGDVRSADDDELLAVSGMGDGNLTALREFIDD